MSSAVINRSTPSGAVLAHVLCGAEIGRTNLRDGAAEVETWLWDRSARIENRGSLTLRRLLAADPAAFASSDAYKLVVALNQPPGDSPFDDLTGVVAVDRLDGHRFRIHHTPSSAPAGAVAQRAVAEGWGLVELPPERRSLEDIFVDITCSEPNETTDEAIA